MLCRWLFFRLKFKKEKSNIHGMYNYITVVNVLQLTASAFWMHSLQLAALLYCIHANCGYDKHWKNCEVHMQWMSDKQHCNVFVDTLQAAQTVMVCLTITHCGKWYYHTYTSISADIHLHPTIELVCQTYLPADVGILSQISWPVLIQSTIGHDLHIYRQQYSWRVQKQLAIAKIWVTDHD